MGEKLGPPLDIDRFLGRAKDRINLVGVELEGGWKELAGGRVRPERDGSVIIAPEEIVAHGIKYLGEVPLPPESTKDFPKTMKLYYPTVVNATCGMHAHISTKSPFTYQRLMVNRPYSYPGTIVEYVKRWADREGLSKSHPIWPRLAGKCEYCQHIFHAEEQIKAAHKDFDHHRDGHRYTVVGFCWGRWKTIECRLLPMMDTAEQGIRAVQEVLNITNAFLAATADREPTFKSTVREDDNHEVIERRSWI